MKIIITGPKDASKYALARSLTYANTELQITPSFTTDEVYNGKLTDTFIYYMSDADVISAYKNGSVLCVKKDTYGYTSGITTDDYGNSNVTVLDFEDINNIGGNALGTDTVFFIIDSKCVHDRTDIYESYDAIDRITSTYPYVWFEYDDTIEHIVDRILYVYNSNNIPSDLNNVDTDDYINIGNDNNEEDTL